jgi:hypothetical protein
MKNDIVSKYITLREGLTKEKQQLEERLSRINEALGESEGFGGAGASRGRGRPPGGSGTLSLREAVLQATGKRSMTKQEILDEVQRLGYRFSTSNPANSLGTILYGKNPRFKNENGYFSLASGSGGGGGGQPAQGAKAGAFARKRRTLSPEARARIAAAQRERWARTRGGK